MESIIPYAATALWFAYTARKLRFDLHMAQQNGYFAGRYLRWARRNLVVALPPLAAVPLLAPAAGPWLVAVWGGLYLLLNLLRRERPQKKALVMTARAKRLYGLSLALAALLALVAVINGLGAGCVALLGAVALASPLLLLAANLLLHPVERAIQRWYLEDARRAIRAVTGLRVIGITGSYGKTSTKFLLGEVLGRHFTTLITPESYNTPMGVTITARSRLKPIHQLFVVEMGAKKRGDIRELCSLAGPRIGVLTAIGPQHLETFGSLETVQATKAELIEALPADGLAVLNWDDDNVRAVADRTRARVVRYGLHPEADYRAEAVETTAAGTRFTAVTPHGEIAIETRLLGAHNVANLLAAVAVAGELGVEPVAIARTIRAVKPVPHRLQLIKGAGGVTIIDDAFNANPTGAMGALAVLRAMGGGRRILITPGMIELGAEQERANRAFGERAAESADYIVLVGPKQTRPIQEGLRAAGWPEEKLYVARNLDDARAHIEPTLRAGDVVLYENDLPDTFAE
ncbi:UDP-N-acetylmuramoyl-tripeptide--D-alanyl-D-alanine ligase [Endothiovibrio diazotrophicus]